MKSCINIMRFRPNACLLLAVFFSIISASAMVNADATNKRENHPPTTVYKSPTCGCCGRWIEHLEEAGFHPLVKHPKNLKTIKNQLNIERQYQSCHTTVHDDYVFEGHIPVKFIQQFLANPPTGAAGLAVPAMPLGSPGMEAGNRFTPYTVYQLNKDGASTVFATVSRMEEQY